MVILLGGILRLVASDFLCFCTFVNRGVVTIRRYIVKKEDSFFSRFWGKAEGNGRTSCFSCGDFVSTTTVGDFPENRVIMGPNGTFDRSPAICTDAVTFRDQIFNGTYTPVDFC